MYTVGSEKVLATETEYDDVHVQPTSDYSKKVVTLILIIKVYLKAISRK